MVVAKSQETQETLSEVQDTVKEVKEIATTQNQAVADVQKILLTYHNQSKTNQKNQRQSLIQ